MISARVHDRVVAEDYYAAMERVEQRLQIAPPVAQADEGNDGEPLNDDERRKLLDLAEQLAEPDLSPEVRMDLVDRARRVLTDGTPSGAPVALCDAGGDQEEVALGFGPVVTETVAAWSDGRSGGKDVYARVVEAKGEMGGEFLVHPAPGDQEQPQVAYNPTGDEYLVVWHDYRAGAGDAGVYAQRVTGGGVLAGENIAVTNAAYHQLYPQVAYATGGEVYLVAWRHYRGASSSSYDVYGQVISPTGELQGDPLAIASGRQPESPTNVVYNPTSDRFLVLWTVEQSSSNLDVWGRHVSPAGSLGSPLQITFTGGGQEVEAAGAYNPADDQYLVVWRYSQSPAVSGDVLGRRMTGGGVVTATETITIAAESAEQGRPDVAYLPGAGRYAVVWEDRRSRAPDIYGRLVSPDGSLDGGQYVVAGGDNQEDTLPRLAPGSAGGALVVWQRDNGGSALNDLYGRWLGNDGRPSGEGFAILEADDDQQWPVVAGDGAGGYLLAWQDDRNGNWDIYGSRFEPLRAGFVATPTVGVAPLRVEFGDGSTPQGVADEWRWAFGTGDTSALQHPVYTYTMAGAYTVTQWVTDTATGETGVLTRTSYVVVSAGGGLVTTTITYDYDPLYRLISATYASGEVYTYTYRRGRQPPGDGRQW